MARIKKGIHGMTLPEVVRDILGTVVVCGGAFDNIKGEIIRKRNDHMRYLTVQVPSEYKGRVYVLNLLYSQCKDIKWRHEEVDIQTD